MKTPEKMTVTLFFYKMPYYDHFKWTDASEMEKFGWELLATKEIEIDTPEINSSDLLQRKRDRLEEQKQKAIESKEIEIAAIDDHLAALLKTGE